MSSLPASQGIQHTPTVAPSSERAIEPSQRALQQDYTGLDARFCCHTPLVLEMKQDLSISGGDWIVYLKDSGEAVMKCSGSWGPRNRVDFFTLGHRPDSRRDDASTSGHRSASEQQLVLSMTCTPLSVSNFQLFLPFVAVASSRRPSGSNIIALSSTSTSTAARTAHPGATITGHSPLSSLLHHNNVSISTSSTFNISLSNTAALATSPNVTAGSLTPTIDLLVRGAGFNDHAAVLVRLDQRGQEVVLVRMEREMWRGGGERVGVWVEGGGDWVLGVAVVVAMKLRRRRR